MMSPYKKSYYTLFILYIYYGDFFNDTSSHVAFYAKLETRLTLRDVFILVFILLPRYLRSHMRVCVKVVISNVVYKYVRIWARRGNILANYPICNVKRCG